jgi:hypothetical protein
VSPVKYELGFYIPEDGILHSHRRENLKSYITNNKCKATSNVYLLGFSPNLIVSLQHL